MRLFSWHSRALKDYYPGQIVAMGETAEQARTCARTGFEPRLAAMRRDDADILRMQFEADIAAEPETITTGVVFIQGAG